MNEAPKISSVDENISQNIQGVKKGNEMAMRG